MDLVLEMVLSLRSDHEYGLLFSESISIAYFDLTILKETEQNNGVHDSIGVIDSLEITKMVNRSTDQKKPSNKSFTSIQTVQSETSS